MRNRIMAITRSTDTVSSSQLLTTFPDHLNAVVIGASGGIGAAIVKQLFEAPKVGRVLALSRTPVEQNEKIFTAHIDLENPEKIESAAEHAKECLGSVHLVFVATGLLHDGDLQPEKTLRSLSPDVLARSFAINAIGPALLARAFIPLMPREGKTAFAAISARVGSITDNGLGGWYSYRASKAALNQLMRTTAIEVARKYKEAVFLALHPGTTDTSLSKPFQSGVPSNKLFTPHYSANRMLQVIDQAEPRNSGQLIAWDGEVLPY